MTSHGSETHARQVVDLHALIARGLGDSPEADDLREAMLETWNQLTPDEQRLMRRLSADLYRVHERPGPAIEATASRIETLLAALRAGDWLTIIDCLPGVEAIYPPTFALYWRARAWSRLGFPDAALAFVEEALRQEPTNQDFLMLRFYALLQANRVREAADKAGQIVRDPQAHPRAHLLAAGVLFKTASLDPGSIESEMRGVERALEEALAREAGLPDSERSSLARASALVKLGLCRVMLGDDGGAIAAFEEALDCAPGFANALAARGMMHITTDPDAAEADFLDAVRAGTTLALPHEYIAWREQQRRVGATGAAGPLQQVIPRSLRDAASMLTREVARAA